MCLFKSTDRVQGALRLSAGPAVEPSQLVTLRLPPPLDDRPSVYPCRRRRFDTFYPVEVDLSVSANRRVHSLHRRAGPLASASAPRPTPSCRSFSRSRPLAPFAAATTPPACVACLCFGPRFSNVCIMSVNVNNLTWHDGAVGREERQKLLGHAGCTIWLTGLSGAPASDPSNTRADGSAQLPASRPWASRSSRRCSTPASGRTGSTGTTSGSG